ATTTQCGFELFKDQEYFAVVLAGILRRLNVHRTDLTTILACGQICSGSIVRVIEAKTRRTRCEGDPALSMRRNERCALFRSAVYVYSNSLTVPVKLLRRISIIEDVDGEVATFLEA